MLQLALETSTRSASAALLDGHHVIAENHLASSEPATVALLPAIRRLLGEAGRAARDVDLVSISIGPGSFTGLRLGIATAKTFAYAANCRLFAVGTHQVLATQAMPSRDRCDSRAARPMIATVIDAQRGQWFAETHRHQADGRLACHRESRIVNPADFLKTLGERCLVCGPGLTRHAAGLTRPAGVEWAATENWSPVARTVGRIAAAAPERGRFLPAFELLPVYGRKSAAEEKLAE